MPAVRVIALVIHWFLFYGIIFVMMTTEMNAKLKQLLIKHEGCKAFPYLDTVGKITIGIGYNLSDRGMTDAWINQQYETDVNYFYTQLNDTFPWFQEINEVRQLVLVDMCFMGFKRFLSFKRMIDALARHNYRDAAHEMLDSKWATQVHGRATELSGMMESGVYPEGEDHGLAKGIAQK